MIIDLDLYSEYRHFCPLDYLLTVTGISDNNSPVKSNMRRFCCIFEVKKSALACEVCLE